MNSGKILGSQINSNTNPNRLPNKQRQSDLSFKGTFNGLLNRQGKAAYGFADMLENGLAWTKVTQDTTTNLGTKASLARSKADLGESVFVEVLESFIVYFAASLLAGKLLKKPFSKPLEGLKDKARKPLSELVSKPFKDIVPKNLPDGSYNKVLSVKSGLLIACLSIPAAEYALNFAKNLFTLKTFKQSDLANIANLNKKVVENDEHQKKVEKSAIINIAAASTVALASVAAGWRVARKGLPQNANEWILNFGEKVSNYVVSKLPKTTEKQIPKIFGIKMPRLQGIIKDYLNMDFAFRELKDKSGILKDKNNLPKVNFGLNAGQVVLVAGIGGLFGYLRAAKDRGDLDFLETSSRLAITLPYAMFGSKVFDHFLMHGMNWANKCKDIIKPAKDGVEKELLHIASLKDLPFIAKDLAKQQISVLKKNNLKVSSVQRKEILLNEYKKVLAQKATMTFIPFAFGIGVMGFAVTLLNQYWTRRRYSHGIGKTNALDAPKNAVRENPAIKELFVSFMNQEKKKPINIKNMEKMFNSTAKTN